MSHHIKVHVLEGRATVDTLGTEPDQDCRVWVTGIDVGDIVIDNVAIEEPIQISVDVGGVETPLTGVTVDSHTYLDVNPLLPNTPEIDCINIADPDTEVPFALPIDSKRFMVYVEEVDGYAPVDLEMGFDPGGNKIVIPCGSNFTEREVDAGAVTLYFKTKAAPQIVKVMTWSVS